MEIILKHALKNAVEHGGKASWKAVISKVVAERPEIKKEIKKWIEKVKEIVEEVNKMDLNEQKKKLMEIWPEAFEKKIEKKELEDLPEAKMGKVVLRAAPAITGSPHIGHAYAFLLNYLYSLKYKGKFVVRYEDTDPRKAKIEYYEDWDWFFDFLNIKYSEKRIISRDFMEDLYKYGRKLIEIGKAYVCLSSQEEIKKARAFGIELKDRERSVEENLELFDKMLEGSFGEGEAVVLFRGDMKSKNTRLRDPTMFRIVEKEHPLVGGRYTVWPTYDFAVAVCDGLQGITHIIRSSEFELARELHDLIREVLGFKKIITIEISRLSVKNNITSKRKIKKLIEEGKVYGWSDPRLVTIKGLFRRGIVRETFYELTKMIGISKAQPELEFEMISAINRKILDPITKRYFCVPDFVEAEVVNIEGGEVFVRNHPNRDLGKRIIRYGKEFYIPREAVNQKEFRLIHLFNVRVIEFNKKVLLEKTGDEIRKDIKKFQWVPKGFERWIELWVVGDLLRGGDFNEDSLKVLRCPAEKNVDEIRINEIIQFERVGFSRKDSEKVFILSHK